MQTWQTVRITIAAIWAMGVGVLLLDMLAVSALVDRSGPIVAALGVELARSVLFGGVWAAYFLRSRRVANTYKTDVDGNALGEVFS